MTEYRTSTKLQQPLLIAGAVAGLLIAATGMVEKRNHAEPNSLPAGNIARVGDTLIPVSRYAVLLDDLSADKRNPLTDKDRKFALDRLIDEELLIQRGVELGLASDAPAVRKAIASAVISQVVADASTTLPDETALREFYLSARTFFSESGQFHVRWWKLDGQQADAMPAAENLIARARSEPGSGELFESYGFEAVRQLPDSLLPASKLLDYLGPTLLAQVTALGPGEFSGPVYANRAVHVFYLVQLKPESTPPFESIKDIVAQEYMYREGDRALREHLEWLRERTSVVVSNTDP